MLDDHKTEKLIYDEGGHEFLLGFAEVYWSPDGRLMGVYAHSFYGPSLRFAYDLQRQQSAPVSEVLDGLRASITKKYSLPSGEDPLKWAASSGARDAFLAKQGWDK